MKNNPHFVYKVQINYKNGISVTSWYKTFEIDNSGAKWEWVAGPKPVLLNPDSIDSIFELETVEITKDQYRKLDKNYDN